MATKKKPTTKRNTNQRAKSSTKKQQAKKQATKSQKTAVSNKNVQTSMYQKNSKLLSVILFAIGLFVLLLTFVSGGAFWYTLHLIFRGLFGLSVFLTGPIIIYIAVLAAMNKSKNIIIAKFIQGGILSILASGLFQAIMVGAPLPINGTFFTRVTHLYDCGETLDGGGVLGGILGWPLVALLGKVGAIIILAILIVVFLMLLTNTTIVDIMRGFSKPIKKGYTAIKEDSADRAFQKVQKEAKVLEAENRNKRIDIAKYYEAENELISKKGKNAEYSMPDKLFDPDPTDFVDDQQLSKIKAKKKQNKKANKEEKKAYDLSKLVDDAVTKAELSNQDKPKKSDIYIEGDGQTTLIGDDKSDVIYKAPPITLLKPPTSKVDSKTNKAEIAQRSETLVDTLRSFGVITRIVGIHRGPSVTRYELQPAAGVKVSKITGLADDIALNLAAEGIRIEAPIPGKAAVGIELANEKRDGVTIRELIDSTEFRQSEGNLEFAVGKDIEGNIVMGDIAKMPHLLIAGTTGSGKSVFTNSIIMNILYKDSPDKVKLILIDPKQVEFPIYNGIPHLLIPVVTDARKAAGALGWAVNEMLHRYKIFADNGVRDLTDYNEYVKDIEDQEPLPQIIIVIDELADLMMAAAKEVEDSICRIAQLARAAGMHLIIATQSPRVDVVTGLIKANIPSRVALKVSNNTDSRVILDEGGAEKLLGRGDLLYKPVGQDKPTRIQGSFVPTSEVRAVVKFLKEQTNTEYSKEVIEEIENNTPQPKGESKSSDIFGENSDEKLEEAINIIIETGQASTSFLQRKLSLGYARAARIIDELEELGIIGESNGSKPREILMSKEQWLERRTMSDD